MDPKSELFNLTLLVDGLQANLNSDYIFAVRWNDSEHTNPAVTNNQSYFEEFEVLRCKDG